MTPREGFNLSAWALRHRTLTLFLLLMGTFSGIFAYGTLGRKEEPEFKFKVMVLRVLWPGATAVEIERQVTDRIERKLQETPNLDYVRSYSRPGESVIFVGLRGETRALEVDIAWYQVRKKVSDIRASLPAGVVGPFFNDEFGDTYVNIYALAGHGFDMAEVKTHADRIRADLIRIPGVEKVDLLGVQDEKIYLEFSHRRLATLGIDPGELFASLAAQNQIAPSGRVVTADQNVVVHPSGSLQDVASIAASPVRVNGTTFRLGDIASVRRAFADPPVSQMRHDGRDVVGIALTMRKGGDVVELGRAVDARIATLRGTLPVGVEIGTVADQPKVVARSAREFNASLGEAVGIVLAVSLLSLGLRTGLVVALTIPVVLALTFLGMKVAGIELHRISFGALIIALGLLVDDAMIAVEMMARKLEEGYEKLAAASYAYSTTAFPMLTGTLITAAGFLPIGISKSVASEYTGSIFSVTTIALIVSWCVAVTFTPYIGSLLLRRHASPGQTHDLYATRFYRRFRAIVEWCLVHRWLVIAATVVAFGSSVYAFRFVAKQFFPSSNRPEIIVSVRLAEDASFAATRRTVERVEALLKADGEVVQVTSFVGQSAARFYMPLNQDEFSSPNYAELVAVAVDSRARERVMQRLRTAFDTDFPDVRARTERLPNGPPVGYPIQFRVSGEDPRVLARIAQELAGVVRADPHVHGVNLDWYERQRSVHVVVDQDKARALGLSSARIRQGLQQVLTGVPVTELREGERTIEVVARAVESERNLAAAVADVHIHTSNGRFVPVSQVARVEFSLDEARVWRRDRLPTITVRADVAGGVQAPDVTERLLPQIAAIREKLGPGYYIDIGGSWYESRINEGPMMAVMPLMGLAIVTLLMIQLQSFGKMVLVLLTAPLGLIGVVAALLAFDAPLGFVAQLGIIALLGMIMRNSVILVDQIQQDMAEGHDAWTAVREATVRRFRPIMLTAAAAILAMIPLTRSELWGPMAVAIMGGLTVATVLTLLFLPSLYAAWYRVRRTGT